MTPEFWDYRVVRHAEDGETWLDVHAVTYTENGEVLEITEHGAVPMGVEHEDVMHDLFLMFEALTKPILDYEPVNVSRSIN